jgi:hypothetical protein
MVDAKRPTFNIEVQTVRSVQSESKMPTRELAPRSSFQILLERASFDLRSECDDGLDLPRPGLCSIWTFSVVPLQATGQTARNSCMMDGRIDTRYSGVAADDGIRTRDLRFTKPLLYQLSYVGAERAKHCIRWRLTQAPASLACRI